MIAFPPCKINLGLNILRRRADGYHDIETCFYPVPWTDVLEVIRSEAFSFAVTGLPIPGAVADNLCVRAYEIIHRDFDIGPVAMHLHKVVPLGAGLGGGSSDAAHALLLINQVFGLGLDNDKLTEYASGLGSDCAFFISEKPAMGTGRGDQLREINVSLAQKFLVLVAPGIHVSTADAYAGITPALAENSPAHVISEVPLAEWKDHIKNDFEFSVIARYPVVGTIKQLLYDTGALYAAMSGSGSAVFGIYDQPVSIPDELKQYTLWSGTLSV